MATGTCAAATTRRSCSPRRSTGSAAGASPRRSAGARSCSGARATIGATRRRHLPAEPGLLLPDRVELPTRSCAAPRGEGEILFLPPATRSRALDRAQARARRRGRERLGFDQVLSKDRTRWCSTPAAAVPGFEGRLIGCSPSPGRCCGRSCGRRHGGAAAATHRYLAALRERLPSFEVRDLGDHLAGLRMVKDAGEIGLLRKAVAATIEATAAGPDDPPRRYPRARWTAGLRCVSWEGAESVAFPSIVGSGINATTLHYDQNADTCADGELVVVDIGARYGYYCGDLTRTFPVNGRFSDPAPIYDLVLRAHDRAAEAIRPGVTIFELRKIVYETFQNSKLRTAGERLGQYFIHGLGHFLGLEARSRRRQRDPRAGDGDHNEPGIYIRTRPRRAHRDNHLVTAGGNENLSRRCRQRPGTSSR